MYQKLILAGHLGRDPEMRTTSAGKNVTSFSMATTSTWVDGEGAKHETTVWWRVSVWGRMAEVCKEYLAKGRKVMVEGEISGDENGNPRLWTDKKGETRASFEVRASTVKFLDSKKDGGSRSTDDGESASEDLPF